MLKRISVFTLVLALLFATGTALAQSYYFNLAKETVNVFWNADGSESIDYIFTFNNNSGGHVIDYVDVGIPNANFDENSIYADINGQKLTDISKSGYQGTGTGVAVGLGSQSIPPGSSGTLHVFIGKVTNVLYQDDQDSNYASAVYKTMYFGSQNVFGATDLTVTFHLPPGVKPEEPRWHQAPSGFNSEPTTGLDQNGQITYSWHNPGASAAEQYEFGASFPKSYIPASAIVRPNPFAFLGTIDWSCLLPIGCLGFFGLIIGLSLYSDQKRKLQYLPPKISIEGNGIKRGLTSIEAALLMEEPMDKILTMILFALIKKNAARVISRDPLEIEPIEPAPQDLYPYETEFLAAFKEKGVTRQKALQDMMVSLVKTLTEKMKGFSRKETIAYYKDITNKAWAQVEAADTPEVKSQKFDEVMEWTMLDRNFNDRTRNVFRTGPVFIPIWWPLYDPGFGRGATTAPISGMGGGHGSPGGGGGGMPVLPGADFAASVVGGISSFSNKVVGNITDFTNRVTQTTNPPPKPTSSSSRSGWGGGGGGRSCACACACAGCACACAGGGR